MYVSKLEGTGMLIFACIDKMACVYVHVCTLLCRVPSRRLAAEGREQCVLLQAYPQWLAWTWRVGACAVDTSFAVGVVALRQSVLVLQGLVLRACVAATQVEVQRDCSHAAQTQHVPHHLRKTRKGGCTLCLHQEHQQGLERHRALSSLQAASASHVSC